MQKPHRTEPARRGAAAVTAAFVLMGLAALAVALLQVSISFNREHDSRRRDESAILLADAGVAEAIHAMRLGGTGTVGRRDTPAIFGNGLFWTEITDVGNDLRRVLSTAMNHSGRACVEALVFHYHDEVLTSALFSNQSFTISSQCLIDSYDSTLGDYATQLAAAGGSFVGTGAVVQSNGDVTIDPSVEVFGDVHPGQDSDVTVAASGDVSGSTQSLAEDRILDPVVVPLVGPAMTLSVPGDGITVLPPGSYAFSDLEVVSGSLTVTGPAILVLHDWELGSNTDLIFDTTVGAIQVYVTGATIQASNSTMQSTTASAADLSINLAGGPGQVAEFKSNAEFHGTIYGPEATVDIASNFEVFGSIAADQLVLAANAQIHYDEALQAIATGDENYLMASWALVELTDESLRTDRTDPFRLLGVDPMTLPAPSAAHDLP